MRLPIDGTPRGGIMLSTKTVNVTEFESLTLKGRGKVRDIYDLGDRLMIVTTDRISAFDVIMPTLIPDKGKVLTQLSRFWFNATAPIVPNHLISTDSLDLPYECRPYREILEGRSMLVEKADVFPVECVVRGYLSGSAWEEYIKTGGVCGIPLSRGLIESSELKEPIFTPATKAEMGDHDQNITFEEMEKIVGKDAAQKLRAISIAVYQAARDYAGRRGIIIADTKMEFGVKDGELLLVDELLTPDSSRFWLKDDYRPGGPQKSFDKQFLRDYLLSIGWNKTPPASELPEVVVNKTREKYLEAYEKLVGTKLDEAQ
jgi:phosphoribosylaminoimidazole-succinocarboxamide synthase